MKNKRGQITIFIIIAIVIIAGVGIFFAVRGSLGSEEEIPQEVAPIVNFVQECTDMTLEETVYAVAEQGGYSGYSYLDGSITDSGVRYYFFEGKNYFPTKTMVENQLEEYFERKFFLCTNSFSDFPDYLIEEGLLETSFSIEDDEVRLKARYPLVITRGGETSKVENFESRIYSRLGVVYNSVSYFIKEHQNRETICLGCLDFAAENEIYVNMTNSYDGTVVFIFRDDSLKLNNKSLEWIFANKY